MELEQPMVIETSEAATKVKPANDGHNKNMSSSSSPSTSTSTSSHVSSRLCHGSESFRNLEMGVPKLNSADKKLSWLRSQIIGGDAEFESPFGTRKLTYADNTASGRCLHYVENFIMNNVLPFYGNEEVSPVFVFCFVFLSDLMISDGSFYRVFLGNIHTCDSYVGQRTTKMVHEASNYIKRCMGGGEDDAILFCGSGTTAAVKKLQEVMGITVPSIMRDKVIKCLSNEERWVVFVGPYEHHSNLLSWRQSLAEVVEIGLNEDGLFDVEALKQELELFKYRNRPLLGTFSACSNVTGIESNTREIAKLMHRHGGFVCFDFAAR